MGMSSLPFMSKGLLLKEKSNSGVCNAVEATFLRAVHEKFEETYIVLEITSLRLTDYPDMSAHDCANALFYAVIKLALNTPHDSTSELYRDAATIITEWQKLLKKYLHPSSKKIDVRVLQIEVIMKLEEMCLEFGELSSLFKEILYLLYDRDLLIEEAIFAWASERERADEADKKFLKQSVDFIEWLQKAPEEEY